MIVLDKNFDNERVIVRISTVNKVYETLDYPDIVRVEVITK